MNFKEYLYFSLFSSATSAALNTIHISYGISYFRHRDSYDIFTYHIARQSIVDKMVREISLEVREFCFHIFVGTLRQYVIFGIVRLTHEVCNDFIFMELII